MRCAGTKSAPPHAIVTLLVRWGETL